MIAGQVVLLSGVHWGLTFPMPIAWIATLVLIAFISNIVLTGWLKLQRPAQGWMIGLVMLLDVLLLTGLLASTGGPANPFSFLYLIYIALGIVVLSTTWIWTLTLTTLLAYGSLFLQQKGHAGHHTIHNPHHMKMHLEGMWIAYAITAVFIGYFVTRMKQALVKREEELQHLKEFQQKGEKIASLASLASGAVHEFSTPLGTIAIVAKELERALDKHPDLLELKQDAQLIREEVRRCKQISEELLRQAGETLGEASQPILLDTLFQNVLEHFPQANQVDMHLEESLKKQLFPLPRVAFLQLLRGLLKNAVEASQPNETIHLHAKRCDKQLCIEVIDHGSGISPDVLKRLGEPFFTTKSASEGHGLALFLAKTTMERLGGNLAVSSTPGEGTTVSLTFPLDTNTQHQTSETEA
jgi:two-component system sensor histidine kinase RegB